ncbi:hypothetical protein [Saccharopolyspora shandongensis]
MLQRTPGREARAQPFFSLADCDNGRITIGLGSPSDIEHFG